jgi:CRISPR type I-E-associated protein CasB/Cse2
VNATEQYIKVLQELKPGDLGLLRTHSGQGLDESVNGFDLFAGLWWPLRQKNQFAPRRKVAWLIAKLYAFCPIEQSTGDTFARQLRRCQPVEKEKPQRFQNKFDELLLSPLDSIEPLLQWALGEVASHHLRLDWVKMTDDLSYWEHESKRLEWARDYLNLTQPQEKEEPQC